MGIMNFTKNKNKRMRLDLENNLEGNVGNDDLWGPEDITADEFDMLEFQATQSVPMTSVNTVVPLKIDSSKQQQYELEGKIKILSDRIETAKKDLVEERLKREKVVGEKTREFEEKEKLMQKQIDNLLSSLQFKDQEMKIVHDKVKTLEVQLKDNKINAKASTSKSPNKYLEKFDFKADVPIRSSETKLLPQMTINRKFALSIDTHKGQTQSCDIMSSMLCNRLFPSQIPFDANSHKQTTDNILSPLSVTKLSLDHKPDDMFRYYTTVLQNYVSFLPVIAESKDVNHKRTIVISCLKDLGYIIPCSQFSDYLDSMRVESLLHKRASQNTESSESSSSSNCDKKHEPEQNERKTHSLLTLLFILSKPETYPNGFTCQEEVELSLSALMSWSATNSKSFLGSFNDDIITSHISHCFSITTTYIALRILINICTFREYLPRSFHKNDTCHLCAIATLLIQTISKSPLECIALMIMVEDFLSSLFSVHTFSDMKLEGTPCCMMIMQAELSTLLKFHTLRKRDHDITLLLKKGFTLLHYLSKYIPNFKFRRVDIEDLYISIVCAMLSLSKEDSSFKDFQEIAHELWDFQEDTSEFDLDDLSDDSTPTTNLRSEIDS